VVSADGSTVAYAATAEPGKMHVVVNGVKGPVYERVERPVIAAKANVVAYRAVAARKAFVVVGKDKQEDFIEVDDPLLSPDGSRVAYRAHDSDGRHVVIGKKRGEPLQEVESVAFSSGGRIVYARVRMNNAPALVIEGTLHTGSKDGSFLWIGPITSSRNGGKVACPAVEKTKGAWRELWWEVFP